MLSEEKIVRAITRGENDKVLRELYRHAFPGIAKFIRSKNGSKEQAEDCFQDAVVGLIMAIKTGRFKEGSSLENYLFAIARNRWFTLVRTKLQHEAPLQQEHQEIHGVAMTFEKEKREALQKALNAIGEQCKQLLHLFVFEKKSLDEVTQQLGLSNVGVAKTYNYRCRKKLKNYIQQNEELKLILRD